MIWNLLSRSNRQNVGLKGDYEMLSLNNSKFSKNDLKSPPLEAPYARNPFVFGGTIGSYSGGTARYLYEKEELRSPDLQRPFADVFQVLLGKVEKGALEGEVIIKRLPVVRLRDLGATQWVGDTPANWLSQALEELNDACNEAIEEGYPPVSDLVRANSEILLGELAQRIMQAPMIHSTPEGGIAIDFRNPGRDAALLILCEPNGEGVCFFDIQNKQGRARWSDARGLLAVVGRSVVEEMDRI